MMKPKYHFEIEQGTPEWHKIKELKMSASHATAIMTNGKGLRTLVEELITDYYSSDNYEEFTNKIQNKHIERGNEYEQKARTIYELETGNEVKQVGFVELDEFTGVSPDGLVGEDGLIEIKNPANKEFMRLALTGKIDSNHLNQMQMQMYVTGRKWCDYFVFNPNYEPCFIRKRVQADPDEFSKIIQGLDTGRKLIREMKDMTDKLFKKQERSNNEQ